MWRLSACDGPPQRHHLVERSSLKRQFPHGAIQVYCHSCDGEGCTPKGLCGVCLNGARLVPVQKLPDPAHEGAKRYSVKELVADKRNLVDVCWKHHQAIHDHRRARVLLPQAAVDFGNWTGLAWRLDRYAA